MSQHFDKLREQFGGIADGLDDWQKIDRNGGSASSGGPRFCERTPRQTSSGTFICECGWNDQARKTDSIQFTESHILSLGGVLWSHVEETPGMYMCRACGNEYPDRRNVYNLDEFGNHLDRTHRFWKNVLKDYIERWYGRFLQQF